MTTSRTAGVLALTVTLLLATAGCAGSTTSSVTDAVTDTDTEASSVVIEDAWAKAVESGMSAAFGVLVNEGSTDVHIVAATSDVSPIMELHETVENADGQMIMREKDGGFVIPAGSSYVLQPGANHLMFMDVVAPMLAGDVAHVAVEFEDGSVMEFEAPIKDYEGANETYVEE